MRCLLSFYKRLLYQSTSDNIVTSLMGCLFKLVPVQEYWCMYKHDKIWWCNIKNNCSAHEKPSAHQHDQSLLMNLQNVWWFVQNIVWLSQTFSWKLKLKCLMICFQMSNDLLQIFIVWGFEKSISWTLWLYLVLQFWKIEAFWKMTLSRPSYVYDGNSFSWKDGLCIEMGPSIHFWHTWRNVVLH